MSTLSLAFSMFITFQDLFQGNSSFGLNYGVSVSNKLYVVTTNQAVTITPPTLWVIDPERVQTPKKYQISYFDEFPYQQQLRWTIHKSLCYSMPFPDTDQYTSDLFQFPIEYSSLLDSKNSIGNYLLDFKYKVPLGYHLNFDLPQENIGLLNANNRTRVFYNLLDSIRENDVYRSFWVSPDGVASEFLVKKKTLYASMGFRISRGRAAPSIPGLQEPRVMKANFHEPFLVFADPDLHFFITKSGSLFYTDRLDDFFQKDARLSKCSDIKDSPIRTIITYPDLMRTFVSGPIAPGSKTHFWFELDKETLMNFKPKTYRPEPFENVPYPIRANYAFSHFLKKTVFSQSVRLFGF